MSASDPSWTVYPAPISAVLQTAEHFGADTDELMRQAKLNMQDLQNSDSRHRPFQQRTLSIANYTKNTLALFR